MKKLMCLALGVSLIGAMIVVAGCGGGGGIGAILGIGLLVVTLTATGPAGAAAFAANVRGQLAENYVLTASYTAIITPTGRTPISTDTVYVDSVSKMKLKFQDLQVEASTDGQYKVEIYPATYTATTSPIFKYYFTESVSNGETASYSTGITVDDTARALIYDHWLGSTTKGIDVFSDQVAQTSIDAVVASITADMTGAVYNTNFQWIKAATAAQTAANTTPVPISSADMAGWWLLTPSYPIQNEYSAIYYSSNGTVTAWSAFDATFGAYTVDTTNHFSTNLTVENNPIIATGTMMNATSGSYGAKNSTSNEVVEYGTYKKISNPSACEGTWIASEGDVLAMHVNFNVNSSGQVTSVTESGDTTDYTGFMVTDGTLPVSHPYSIPAVLYLKSPSRASGESADNEIRVFGHILDVNGKQCFSGTIETDNPGLESPTGFVMFQKQ